MELNEYQKRAMETCLPESDNFAYMFFGLVEEVGELAGKFSKPIRKGIACIGCGSELAEQLNPEDQSANDVYFLDKADEQRDAIKKELGDVAWMLAGLCHELGWTLEEICQDNLDKLASRKSRGVIDGNGDNR